MALNGNMGSHQNAQQYVASIDEFNMDRIGDEILTKIFRIIFNENLSPCSPCDPWIKISVISV